MIRITPEISEYIKANMSISKRKLADAIAKKYGLTFNQSTIGRHKNKLKQAMIAPPIAPPKPSLGIDSVSMEVPKPDPKKIDLQSYMETLKEIAGISDYLVENGKVAKPKGRKKHPTLHTPTTDGSRTAFYNIIGKTARGMGIGKQYDSMVYLRDYLSENLESLKPFMIKGYKKGD